MSKKQLKKERKTACEKYNFIQNVIHNNAMSCNDVTHKDFDIEESRRKSATSIAALNVDNGLEAMLASQMLSVHQLQQTAMIMVNGLPYGEHSQYYTNTAIKLSHVFVVQANLLAKLQGTTGQNVTVKRVDVNQGGQAIIGTIHAPER